jgi:hypothetical protein
MYRIRRPDGSLSDMVNLTRAKDALAKMENSCTDIDFKERVLDPDEPVRVQLLGRQQAIAALVPLFHATITGPDVMQAVGDFLAERGFPPSHRLVVEKDGEENYCMTIAAAKQKIEHE